MYITYPREANVKDRTVTMVLIDGMFSLGREDDIETLDFRPIIKPGTVV